MESDSLNAPLSRSTQQRVDTEQGLTRRAAYIKEGIEEMFSYERFAEMQRRLDAMEVELIDFKRGTLKSGLPQNLINTHSSNSFAF